MSGSESGVCRCCTTTDAPPWPPSTSARSRGCTPDSLWPRVEALVDAVDTWNQWNTRRPVSDRALLDSLESLNESLRAPTASLDDDRITRHHYRQPTGPVQQWLTERGLTAPARAVEHEIDLGIDL